ncbi:heparan sulfate glucosamine 3-O-sulfotransferase 5 [Condylostylus longicornis]|uniref:heparan sulfate glucosamine 3-O-sulfotransferase 5 n=1 Tax=Condylostylus longicornis TaxID=2530218 RepID=UPI00244E19A4|nr:heparan sulfate glucosamine 3-O-sulfotransferase 5 [Condylostylus longicornis]XP_055374355.1 heparan sulfate glucosamine 3-O-sulfotransferase 5 [Condylostylus longicornis]XP_055374356.1 heparan sulfate glucosamine 3-O-sulfotransferase 5 [Condylostylus longicornis]XP_055374357.1 heparan sulfate glucosamine 3-O-sulfotransferase 5 [Condylostylus longicornis]XP_055374358.1 heparan sulfate glucosamine 3-O-sulfotransferase 5 [Condylostylus longicornis]XP_055374359.1 heparan sulfate glucosamine 3-
MTAKRRGDQLRDCSVKLPLDILWLPKSAMRPVGPDTAHSDCILVVGVSRPKLAAVFLTVMLISLFLTFHVLYDSAVYNIQAAQAVSEQHRLSLITNRLPEVVNPGDMSPINHPMVFPNRVHFPKTSRRLPQALIVGVRKCGTRALLEMLYLHPRIQKAGGEVHFFDRDENYMKGLEWYRKKMPHSFRGQITIEKSPSYFVSPEVPERVRAMNASIKLLLIVREPVTRAISDYTQLRSHATTASVPLAEIPIRQQMQQQEHTVLSSLSFQYSPTNNDLGDIDISSNNVNGNIHNGSDTNDNSGSSSNGNSNSIRNNYIPVTSYTANGFNGGTYISIPSSTTSSSTSTSGISKTFEELAIFPNGTVNESYRPLTISMYHLHLHRWLEVFPREQLLVVNGDLLIDDPVSQLKRIESFLGIEHRISSKNFYFNETKGFYCLRYDSGDRCLRETKGRKHPHVNPLIVSKLRKFFAEYNQKFYELVGEDLGWPEE